MPKLVITIVEKHVTVPDNPDKCLVGFEKKYEHFNDDNPSDHSTLLSLCPILARLIDEVFHVMYGHPVHSGDGELKNSESAAIEKAAAAIANPFPAELEIKP